MTNIVNLIKQWEDSAGGRLTSREYRMRLTVQDAARIAALAEMYPRRSETELISELLAAALDELETAMPYIQGNQVVAEDEEGNPVYGDVGPTPRFLELNRKHFQSMAREEGLDRVSEAHARPIAESKSGLFS
ncbi:MAG: type 1 pili tip component [Gallionellaceae bacterium]|nr:type 1 pili tip component [Gallionellaceae bacterium]